MKIVTKTPNSFLAISCVLHRRYFLGKGLSLQLAPIS